MNVSISGIAETRDALKRIDAKLSNMEEAMGHAALVVTGAARQNAPVDTGLLRASILPSVTSKGNVTTGIVGSRVAYAPFMELGTRPHWPPLAALQVWARRHGTTAYVVARAIARRGLKPRFYLKRALEDNQDRIIRILDEGVKKITRGK